MRAFLLFLTCILYFQTANAQTTLIYSEDFEGGPGEFILNTGSLSIKQFCLKYCHTITVSSDIVQADDRDDEDLQQGAGHRLQHLPVLPSRGLQGNRVIMTYLFLHYTCTVCTKISDCNR